jgi:uncharacterized protein
VSTADLFVSGSDYHRTIESLIARIHASGWAFDHVVCIARGGLQAGEILSRAYRKPLGILFAGAKVSQIACERDVQGAVLLVDDIADSGTTLVKAREALQVRHPGIVQLRTAVLWRQPGCAAQIDYCVMELKDNTRVHAPHEPFVLNSLEGLVERVRQREEREGK